jgi:hypothetical protein
VLGAPARTMAQEPAQISGTVIDQIGSPIPGVMVTLKSRRAQTFAVAEEKTTSAATDERGHYVIKTIPVDNAAYTLTIELPGFRTVVNKDIAVQPAPRSHSTRRSRSLWSSRMTGGDPQLLCANDSLPAD